MNSFRPWVKQHAFVIFLVLTFILSWWPWLFYIQGTFDFALLPFGPVLAALIVVPLAGGRHGFKEWLRTCFKWRVGLLWYVVAIGFPIALTAIPAGINILLGATADTSVWPNLAGFLGELVGVFLFVGIGEETGFSGFSLPRLLRGRTVLATVVIMALVRVIWHLPSFMSGDTEWPVALLLIPTQLIFTWIFIRSGGSAFLLLLAHTSIGAVGYTYFTALFSGAELTQMVWLEAAAFVIAGVLLLIFSKFMRSAMFAPHDTVVAAEVQAAVVQ